MNLLFDKKEKLSEDSSEEKNQAETIPSEKNDISFRVKKKAKPPRIKKKGVPIGFFYFIIIPLIVMSLVVVYMFYFKKDIVFKPQNQIPSSKVRIQDKTSTNQQRLAQDLVQPSDTAKVVSQAFDEEARDNVTARIIEGLVSSMTADVNLSTLYLDENTFSAQVKTNSQTGLEALYTNLQNKLPSLVKINTTPQITNSQALISGMYSMPQRPESVKPSKVFDKTTIESELSKLISKNNARMMEFSIGPNQSWNNKTRALIFIKVDGSIDNCQKVVSDILHSGWDLNVSKIILMPSNVQNSILVLRVFIMNPA